MLWVYERAVATRADFVAVATDDERIAEVVRNAGGRVVMTAPTTSRAPIGSPRWRTRCGSPTKTLVVNLLQGDEPLVAPGLVTDLARAPLDRTRLRNAILWGRSPPIGTSAPR